MEDYIRKLQQIVLDYRERRDVTYEEIAAASGGALTAFQIGHLVNGKAARVDVLTFAGYARALGLSFAELAERCGIA